VTVNLDEQPGVETTVPMPDLRKAFVELVAWQLPETVTVPPGVTGYRPGRLLVLLVDNLERASYDVLEELRSLRSGSLNERVLLICAGRAEDRPANSAAPHLLTCDLDRLDDASCRAWLTRSGVTDQALREAILRLCQGVPLLLWLCLHEVEQARAQSETLGTADFALPPQPGGEASLHVVEEFLVARFIERLERGGKEGERLSRLVRFGCVLPNFADRDAIRALQIDGLPDDLDPLIRDLGNRGMMSGEELHPVVRQAALARLARREPQRLRDSCARALADYARKGRLVEALNIWLQAGEVIPDEEFAQQVATKARSGDVALARRMVAAVERFAPQRTELAWTAALARVDLARTTGKRDAAKAELVHAIVLAGEQPERVAALEERVRTLEQEQPLRNGMLLRWWLPRQPDSSDVLQRLLDLGKAFTSAYQYADATALLGRLWQWRSVWTTGGARPTPSWVWGRRWQCRTCGRQRNYQQALDIYRAIGARQGEACALLRLGEALLRQAKVTAAQGYYQQALDIGDWQGEARALVGLGDALLWQAKVTAAQGYYQQALNLARATDDQEGAAYALRYLGEALRLRGDRQRAVECLEEALAIGCRIQYRAVQLKAVETLIALA
jgi:tetratricopeptide (TPR) repeat protein